jgi:hypothetical protein
VNLGWYINRLRSMGPAEIVHRAGEAALKRLARDRLEGWERYPAGPPPVVPGLRDAIGQADPAMRVAIKASADRVLAGEFSALGRDWPQRPSSGLFTPSLWRLDPVTGGLWPGPDTYTHDIDFRHDGKRGDIKYVWEINRLQLLMPLGTEALLSGDAGCIAAIEACIENWHAANPPFRGVGWASGIEVALRAISLIVVSSLVGDRLSAPTIQRIGEVLAASAFWLARFPSRYSSANNHRIAELAGLYLIGMAQGREPPGPRAELVAEVLKQILPDGAGAEQSPTYAAFTVEMALLCALSARAIGAPFPGEFDDRLAAFADFVACIGGEGPTPAFGDDDEGRVLTLLDHEADYARSLAGAIGGYLGRPGPQVPDFRALVFGTPPRPATATKGLRTFINGGTSIWHGRQNGRDVRLTFDHGPLGYLSIAAHGHADALSVTLSIDGKPVLVDPGTYLYGSGGEWRRWFRSTPAHNTLNLDRVSQSTMSGAFNWSDKAMARLEESGTEPQPWLRATHDGYRKRLGRTVQRTIQCDTGKIAVTDQLIGGPPLEAELVFQLAPGLEATIAGSSVLVRSGGETLLKLAFHPGELDLRTGAEGVDGGWVSPRFGHLVPATRISWRGEIGEGGLTTLLTPLAPTKG